MTGAPRTSIVLISIARRAIEAGLGRDVGGFEPAPDDRNWLEARAATFVTLERNGELRGCVGSLQAGAPLIEDLERNARAAAFEDPRFPPLTEEELEGLSVEVSVLSEPQPIECQSEAELLAQLRPGVDGLLLEYGLNRATFLPQVWESLPSPTAFLQALKRKARLERDFWSERMRFSRYTVEKHTERPED